MKKITSILLKEFIDKLKYYSKKGLFSIDYIGPEYEYYKCCHSRALGILIQAVHNSDYIADVERAIYFYKPMQNQSGRNSHQFRPDITIVNNENEIVGIIEYESIDASWNHLNRKIKYFDYAIPKNPHIQTIVYIPTLTTLSKKPNQWIEKNRLKYVSRLGKSVYNLSRKHSQVEFIFGYLYEEGVHYYVYKEGLILTEKEEKIFSRGS